MNKFNIVLFLSTLIVILNTGSSTFASTPSPVIPAQSSKTVQSILPSTPNQNNQNYMCLWVCANIKGQVYVVMANNHSGIKIDDIPHAIQLQNVPSMKPLKKLYNEQLSDGIAFSVVTNQNQVWIYAQGLPGSQNPSYQGYAPLAYLTPSDLAQGVIWSWGYKWETSNARPPSVTLSSNQTLTIQSPASPKISVPSSITIPVSSSW